MHKLKCNKLEKILPQRQVFLYAQIIVLQIREDYTSKAGFLVCSNYSVTN